MVVDKEGKTREHGRRRRFYLRKLSNCFCCSGCRTILKHLIRWVVKHSSKQRCQLLRPSKVAGSGDAHGKFDALTAVNIRGMFIKRSIINENKEHKQTQNKIKHCLNNKHFTNSSTCRAWSSHVLLAGLAHTKPVSLSLHSQLKSDDTGYTKSPNFSPEREGDERDGDDEQVEQVEGRAAEGARVQDEAVRYHLEADLHREHGRKEVVKVAENLPTTNTAMVDASDAHTKSAMCNFQERKCQYGELQPRSRHEVPVHNLAAVNMANTITQF